MALTRDQCEHVPCPLTELLLSLLEQCGQSPGESIRASTMLESPCFILNTILAHEVRFQEKVIFNTINRTADELRNIFPKKDSVRQFQNLAAKYLEREESLKPFTEDDVSALKNEASSGADDVLHEIKAQNAMINSCPPHRLHDLDVLPDMQASAEKHVLRSQVLVRVDDVSDVESSMYGLYETVTLPETRFYLEGAVLEVEGRTFSKIAGDIKVLPGLRKNKD